MTTPRPNPSSHVTFTAPCPQCRRPAEWTQRLHGPAQIRCSCPMPVREKEAA